MLKFTQFFNFEIALGKICDLKIFLGFDVLGSHFLIENFLIK